MKNIFKITFVIIGTLIGAGFASGQEMHIFFFSYGTNGLWGLLISSILMGIIIYKTLKMVDKYGISNYKELIDIIINKNYKQKYLNLKYILNLVVNIFILVTFFIMVAGFGAYFEQEIGINHFFGSIIISILCFIVFMTSVKGLVKVNQILIPILILLICLIGVLNFLKIDWNIAIDNIYAQSKTGWLLSSILYCSYNSILLIPTLITLKNYIKNKNNIILVSIFTTLIVILLSTILFFILSNINGNMSNIEMPAVYVIESMFKKFNLIYGFVIISSIFTTSISLGTSFLQNTSKNKKSYTHIAIIMCIIAVITSNFGFSNLVNLLYPIFGYLGLAQIFMMFYK